MYEGLWRENKKEGKGKEVRGDGKKYEGGKNCHDCRDLKIGSMIENTDLDEFRFQMEVPMKGVNNYIKLYSNLIRVEKWEDGRKRNFFIYR